MARDPALLDRRHLASCHRVDDPQRVVALVRDQQQATGGRGPAARRPRPGRRGQRDQDDGSPAQHACLPCPWNPGTVSRGPRALARTRGRRLYDPAAMSTKPAGERLLSLDAFRGATIAGMILVNNSGD